jgi:hypothetical protein
VVTVQAFQALKDAMCSTPTLVVLDFTKVFFLECDMSGKGIGAVLMQEGKLLGFTSKQLFKRHLEKSTYEKKALAILHAVNI